jgi:ketosteroid isomerase-like protein
MAEKNIEIVHRLLQAFNELDAEKAVALFAPDGEWRPAFTGGGLVEGAVYRGHDGLRAYFGKQAETWQWVEAKVVEARAMRDRVFVGIQLAAEGRSSGVPVDRPTWNVFVFERDKVKSGTVYTSRKAALAAAGLSEANKGEIMESETKPPEEPHPDELRGNGETASEGEEEDEGKAEEHHADEATEPDKGLPE